MEIRTLFSTDSLRDFSLVAGERGLDHAMHNIVLLEYESLRDPSPGYYSGDFLVTTLYHVRNNPQSCCETIRQLISLGASGLAYKSVYYDVLPQEILQYADECGFPIFRFSALYMEDVILRIHDLLQRNQHHNLFEEHLFSLLNGSTLTGETESYCETLNPGRMNYMSAVYIHSSDFSLDWTSDFLNLLHVRRYSHITEHCRFLCFRRGLFIIFNQNNNSSPELNLDYATDIFNVLQFPMETLYFGTSNQHTRASNFDLIIQESFNALLYGLLYHQQLTAYSTLRSYQALFPMMTSKISRNTMISLLDHLQSHPKDNQNAYLLSTLSAYSKCEYNINKTAQYLNQHPNTIRYRLHKIKELIAAPDQNEHSLYLLGEFHRLFELSESIL